ncbi:unnamed protein product [Chrysodeixis includens]|uniref:Uncharacterized protein n=1 Tax=Chrysodeixis includens TaxID=689277 RepID=A0A9N8Q102_CHRIL|nr:unnamed protein product [Chrysodeixis includens]
MSDGSKFGPTFVNGSASNSWLSSLVSASRISGVNSADFKSWTIFSSHIWPSLGNSFGQTLFSKLCSSIEACGISGVSSLTSSWSDVWPSLGNNVGLVSVSSLGLIFGAVVGVISDGSSFWPFFGSNVWSSSGNISGSISICSMDEVSRQCLDAPGDIPGGSKFRPLFGPHIGPKSGQIIGPINIPGICSLAGANRIG